MKVGLIIPLNTRRATYINNYLSFFQSHHIDYKTIVWDRLGGEDKADYPFCFRIKDSNKFLTIIGYFLLALKFRRINKKEKFDRIIVFTIAPMFFLGKSFLSSYKGRFIADIRDDSPFKRKFPDALRKMGDLSYATTVSSPKYAAWFHESILCHNIGIETIEEALAYTPQPAKGDVLRIVCAGTMMEEEKNIEIIRELGNDDRVKLAYIGRRNDAKLKIERFAEENGIKNIEFQGEYRQNQIVDIYRKQADLVNIFRANSTVNAEALPNKLYEAVAAGVPIAVFSHNTAVADYAKEYSLGLILEDKPKISEELFTQYQQFSFADYEKGRAAFLRKVLSDLAKFEEMLEGFIR